VSGLTADWSISCTVQFFTRQHPERAPEGVNWKGTCTTDLIGYSDEESQDIFSLIAEVSCKNFWPYFSLFS